VLAIFQFPISDVRRFHPDASYRLDVPDWPNPHTDITPQFVHYFGRAVQRRREVDMAWPDETTFCVAKRALRFEKLAERRAGLASALFFHPQCAFRRLFCDGEAVVRVEVGLAHHPQARKLDNVSPHQVLRIAYDLCDLPAGVPQGGGKVAANKLLRQGPALARLYARASLKVTAGVEPASAEALVEAGNPLVVLELGGREAPRPLVPDGFTPVSADHTLGAHLAFGRLTTRSGVVGTWILQRGDATREQVRMLRLSLLRLHAEQEGLDLVIKQIRRERIAQSPDAKTAAALDQYFNEKTRLINRDKWAGIRQSAILAAFDAAERVTPPATRKNLIERYAGARRQVWEKIEDYQIRRASIRTVSTVNVQPGATFVAKSVTVNQSGTGNIINIAEYMSGVTNQVTSNLQQSSSSEEVKALVQQLVEQVKALSPEADPKLTQAMGKNLKRLSEELAEPEPDPAWYEVSLKGLKEAAEAVGEIAKPVIATVAKLMPLLLGAV
jgi:hypothetical protein